MIDGVQDDARRNRGEHGIAVDAHPSVAVRRRIETARAVVPDYIRPRVIRDGESIATAEIMPDIRGDIPLEVPAAVISPVIAAIEVATVLTAIVLMVAATAMLALRMMRPLAAIAIALKVRIGNRRRAGEYGHQGQGTHDCAFHDFAPASSWILATGLRSSADRCLNAAVHLLFSWDETLGGSEARIQPPAPR